MSSKYIDNGAYATSGYTLDGVNQAITIGTSGVIGGPGLIGGTRDAYTIVNRGKITGSNAGVALQDGGSVTNSGPAAVITGYTYGVSFKNVRGAVTNSGTIDVTDSFSSAGILLADGGGVANTTAGALIEGNYGVVIANAVGTITNSGKIEGLNNDGVGITLDKGGAITNSAGALIEGSTAAVESVTGNVSNAGAIEATGSFRETDGIFFTSTATVTNSTATALIEGETGIYFKGLGTLTNTGTVRGFGSTTSQGVILYSGGLITNNTGALIEGVRDGVVSQGGVVHNSGRIIASGTNGIAVYGDGNAATHVVNNAGALLEGAYGVILGGAGVLTNAGTLIGRLDGAIGGNITNSTASSVIEGAIGVRMDEGTLVNFGTIESTAGAGGVAANLQSMGDLLVNEAGSRFIGKVEANDGFMNLVGTNGTLAGLGTEFVDFGRLVQELAGSSWTFAGTNEIGSELLIDGAATITGALTQGTYLVIGGGTTTFKTGASLSTQFWQMSKAAVVYDASLAYANPTEETATTFVVVQDTASFTGSLSLTGGGLSGDGGGVLATHGKTALAGFFVDQGAVWQDFGTVNESVGLTLGNAGGGAGTLTVKPKAIFDITTNVGIAIAAGGKGNINNAGLLEKTVGTGLTTIAPAIANDGTLSVATGTLNVQGAVTGTGMATIGKAAMLKFDAAVAATQTVKFAGTTGGVLKLNDPLGTGLSFAGTVSGFGGTDKLDLPTFLFANKPKLAFVQNGATGTLTVTDGKDIARITLFGQFVAAGFKAANDGAGGTAITFTAPTQAPSLALSHH